MEVACIGPVLRQASLLIGSDRLGMFETLCTRPTETCGKTYKWPAHRPCRHSLDLVEIAKEVVAFRFSFSRFERV